MRNRGLRSLEALAARRPESLEEALLMGMGPAVSRALFLVADLIYGKPPSPPNDPVTHPYDPFKYAYAIGGKDGVPYPPIDRRTADEVIATLRSIVENAKLEEKYRRRALGSLARLSGSS